MVYLELIYFHLFLSNHLSLAPLVIFSISINPASSDKTRGVNILSDGNSGKKRADLQSGLPTTDPEKDQNNKQTNIQTKVKQTKANK